MLEKFLQDPEKIKTVPEDFIKTREALIEASSPGNQYLRVHDGILRRDVPDLLWANSPEGIEIYKQSLFVSGLLLRSEGILSPTHSQMHDKSIERDRRATEYQNARSR